MSFIKDDILCRIAATYESGMLVPFLGAGMSAGVHPLWASFIKNLEQQAGIVPKTAGETPDELIRRADMASRVLRMKGAHVLVDGVSKAIGEQGLASNLQTEALTELWYPLVITTNYDDMCVRLLAERFNRQSLLVRGRTPSDCQDVLVSLRSPSDPIVWAIQGYLGSTQKGIDVSRGLRDQLVVGHHDYRSVTHREPHFRKAFAEVYRNRSFLFVGSGLRETYLLELFGEILEFYGVNPQYHFAFIKRGEADPDFLMSRFNTIAIEYDKHEELPDLLHELHQKMTGCRPKQTSWSFHFNTPAFLKDDCASDLELVRGQLPHPKDNECVVFSAGGATSVAGVDWAFSHGIQNTIVAMAKALSGSLPQLEVADCGTVAQFGALPLFAIAARDDIDKRDLRLISRTTRQYLDRFGAQFCVIHIQLLAVGRGRVFPARFALIEMIRAFRDWKKETGFDTKMALHLTDPGVLFELSTNRIDINELLYCTDVRFWVEIVWSHSNVERYLEHEPTTTAIMDVMKDYAVPQSGWSMQVVPAPDGARGFRPVPNASSTLTLDDVGIVPGSTLRFVADEAK